MPIFFLNYTSVIKSFSKQTIIKNLFFIIYFCLCVLLFYVKMVTTLMTGDDYIDNYTPAYLNPYLMSVAYP
jgi:hypothetical protein